MQCLCCVLLICWLFYLILLFLSIQNMTGTCPKRAVAAITDSHNLPNRFKQWERPNAKKLTHIVLAERKFQKLWANKNSKQKPRTTCKKKKVQVRSSCYIFIVVFIFEHQLILFYCIDDYALKYINMDTRIILIYSGIPSTTKHVEPNSRSDVGVISDWNKYPTV